MILDKISLLGVRYVLWSYGAGWFFASCGLIPGFTGVGLSVKICQGIPRWDIFSSSFLVSRRPLLIYSTSYIAPFGGTGKKMDAST